MSKPPSRPHPNAAASTPFASGAGRATIGLPGAAGAPTVRLPGVAMAGAPQRQAPRAPTREEVVQALHKGGALFAAKRFDEAEKVAGLILQFEPRQADALHLMGLIKLARNEPVEAEKLMLKAQKLLPRHPVLLVNLGNAARAQQKTQKALKYYEQAQKISPLHEDVYLERGILFTDSRRFEEALEDFEHVLTLNPTSVAAVSGAAHAASELGQFRRSIELCERGLALMTEKPITLLAMIAVNHERLSDLEAAIAAAERVLEMDPAHCACLRVWAKARRRLAKRDATVLHELKARLTRLDFAALDKNEARIIYSELANICDELGETEEAFRYFQLQNDMTSLFADEVELDRDSFRSEVDMLLEQFQPEALTRLQQHLAGLAQPSDSAQRQPVFIVGFPRSGTTLLDQILDAHPQVQVIEEQPVVRMLRDAVADLPGGYPKALLNLREPQRKRLQDIYWRNLEKHGGDFSKPVIVDKMPLSLIHAPVISAVFPGARIILALRHPADSCLSCFMQDFSMNGAMLNFTSIPETMRLYDQVMTLWQRYEAALALNVREVRYENLITDLRAEVEPVLTFLGLDWHEAVSDPAAHARARGTIRTPSYAQVTQPIYRSAADRWRRYEPFLAPSLPLLEKHIKHFGYPA